MAEWTRAMPWRQGSVITLADLMAIGTKLPEGCAGGLVITHDCDLANGIEVEPLVECLPFTRLEAPDGNCLNAKNPRVLHMALQLEGAECDVQLCAPQKFSVTKNDLAAFQPTDSLLSDKDRQVLQGWLAARYRRHAFPDELVERMRPVTAYLEKQLKRRAQGVLGVWVDYDPRLPLTDEEPYELWLYIVYSTDSPDNHSQAEELANNLTNRFSTPLPGLILAESAAVSEAGFTLTDQRRTVEFKFEHLSHRIFPDGAYVE